MLGVNKRFPTIALLIALFSAGFAVPGFLSIGSGAIDRKTAAAQAGADSSEPPALWVPGSALHIGRVYSTGTIERRLPIQNMSDREVRGTLRASCTCVEIRSPSIVIPPGATQNVELVLRLPLGGRGRHIHFM